MNEGRKEGRKERGKKYGKESMSSGKEQSLQNIGSSMTLKRFV